MLEKFQSCLTASAVAFAASALLAGQAQAATFDVSFSGLVDNGTAYHFNAGGTHYDQWVVDLSLATPFTVSLGDTVNAITTLDKSVTIPASVNMTSFLFGLTANPFPSGEAGTSGTTTFFSNGVSVLSQGGDSGSSGWIPSGITLGSPNNVAITFDSVVANFTISALSAPVTVTGGRMYYTLFSPAPVPEPETYAMMIAGLGMLGAIARRRKNGT